MNFANFSNLNQEIFFHILSYLQPRDLQRLSQSCTSLGQFAHDELLERCCSCFAQKFSSMDNRSPDVLQRKAKTICYLKGKVTQKSLDTRLNNAIRNKCFPAFI